MTCPHADTGHSGMEGADPLSMEVFHAFKRVMRANRRMMGRSALVDGGHPAQAGCLWTLAHNDGITQRELAEQLQLAPATVTTMLQRMEREGSIERWTDPDDQRLTRIRLTDAGRETGRRHGAALVDYVNRVLGSMSEPDRRELARLLDLLADTVTKELDE